MITRSTKNNENSLVAGNIGYAGVKLYKKNGANQANTNSKMISNISSYPNPFNPSTTIKFSISEASNVTLDIFNVKGQKVKTLVNQRLAIGTHGIFWNGKDNNEKQVGSGLYFYKIKTDKDNTVGRLIMIK